MIKVEFQLKKECRLEGKYSFNYQGKPHVITGDTGKIQFQAETMDEAIAAVDMSQIEEFHLVQQKPPVDYKKLIEERIISFRGVIQVFPLFTKDMADHLLNQYDKHFCITDKT